MKYKGVQNCGNVSNSSTKRSGNASKQSTHRGKGFQTNEHSTCFSSPRNQIAKSKPNYSQIHLTDKEANHQLDAQMELKRLTRGAIVIQRYWRFHLLMRRRTYSLLIGNLEKESLIWNRTLDNAKIENQILQERMALCVQRSKQQVSLQLYPLKESMKMFIQTGLRKEMALARNISRLQKQTDYHQKYSNTIRQSILQHQDEILKLISRQKYFKEREQSHILNSNRLNKELILVNMQKSHLQLQVDQICLQLKEKSAQLQKQQ